MNYGLVVGKCISSGIEYGKYRLYEFKLISNRIMFPDSEIRVLTQMPALTMGQIYKIRGHLEIIELNGKRVPAIIEKEVISSKHVRSNFTKHRLLNQLYSNMIYLDKLTVLTKKQLGKQMYVRFKQEAIINDELQVLNFFAIVVGNAKNAVERIEEGDVVDGMFIVNRNKHFDSARSADEIGLKVTHISLTEKELERAVTISQSWNFRKDLTASIG